MTKDDLSAALVQHLKELRRTEDEVERTRLVRLAAQATVSLREHFLTNKGEPDWAARTWPYREHIRERYTEAGYEPGEAKTVQAAVRYHVSRIIRQTLPEETVKDLGLRRESSVERGRASRAARSEFLQQARESMGLQRKEGTNAIRNLTAVLMVLQHTTAEDITSLSSEDRKEIRDALNTLGQRVAELAEIAASSAAAGAGGDAQ